MTNDDFENQLRRVPMREIPAGWRHDILDAAAQSSPVDSAAILQRKQTWWHDLLWPAPQAWAALAFIWIVILALDRTGSSESLKTQQHTSVSMDDVIVKIAQERSLAGNHGAFGL